MKKSANASKFWKNIKFLTGNRFVSVLPNCITKDGIKIVNKLQMLNCFNSHFTEYNSVFLYNIQCNNIHCFRLIIILL